MCIYIYIISKKKELRGIQKYWEKTNSIPQWRHWACCYERQLLKSMPGVLNASSIEHWLAEPPGPSREVVLSCGLPKDIGQQASQELALGRRCVRISSEAMAKGFAENQVTIKADLHGLVPAWLRFLTSSYPVNSNQGQGAWLFLLRLWQLADSGRHYWIGHQCFRKGSLSWVGSRLQAGSIDFVRDTHCITLPKFNKRERETQKHTRESEWSRMGTDRTKQPQEKKRANR